MKKMTKREIEDRVIAYAAKAHSNSNIAAIEVKDRIHTAVKEIVALSFLFPNKGKDFKFGNNQKVLIILSAMRKDITAIILKRSNVAKDISNRLNKGLSIPVSDWDNADWLTSEMYGKSYAQRLGVYVSRLKFELEGIIAVSQNAGYDIFQTTDMFMSNIESPHTNNMLLDAAGFAAVRASGILKTPLGGIKSAFKSIGRLNEDIMMVSYNTSNRMSWDANGLMKYIVNGRNPCPACQELTGIIYPASEQLIPKHSHCACCEVVILPYD